MRCEAKEEARVFLCCLVLSQDVMVVVIEGSVE